MEFGNHSLRIEIFCKTVAIAPLRIVEIHLTPAEWHKVKKITAF
jgi:hypothetical protein